VEKEPCVCKCVYVCACVCVCAPNQRLKHFLSGFHFYAYLHTSICGIHFCASGEVLQQEAGSCLDLANFSSCQRQRS